MPSQQPGKEIEKEKAQARSERDELLDAIREMRKELDALKAKEPIPEDSLPLAARVSALEGLVQPGGKQTTESTNRTGQNEKINYGELMVYSTIQGGSKLAPGGWFKLKGTPSSDEMDSMLTPNVNQIAVCEEKEGISYDTGIGIPYHTVKFRTYKQFTKRGVATLCPSVPRTEDEKEAVKSSFPKDGVFIPRKSNRLIA